MCGRYATTRGAADLAAIFDAIDETGGALAPDYNVAPTDPVPIVRSAPQRRLSVARWGLVPAWADDPGRAGRPAADPSPGSAPGSGAADPRPGSAAGSSGPADPGSGAAGRGSGSRGRGAPRINARAETVATSSAFAASFRRHRCLVPADGWYEWRRREDGRGKQAYFMTPRDGSVLAFAGLSATSSAGVLTCSVVTTAAVGDLAAVHDRMPLLLPADRWSQWLSAPVEIDKNGNATQSENHRMLNPELLLALPPIEFLDALEIRPVGPAVGDVRNDGPQLIRRTAVTALSDFGVEPTDLTLF
jgi:putative SOS response-associated peptidase YedK